LTKLEIKIWYDQLSFTDEGSSIPYLYKIQHSDYEIKEEKKDVEVDRDSGSNEAPSPFLSTETQATVPIAGGFLGR